MATDDEARPELDEETRAAIDAYLNDGMPPAEPKVSQLRGSDFEADLRERLREYMAESSHRLGVSGPEADPGACSPARQDDDAHVEPDAGQVADVGDLPPQPSPTAHPPPESPNRLAG